MLPSKAAARRGAPDLAATMQASGLRMQLGILNIAAPQKHLDGRCMLAAWLSPGRLESIGCCLLHDACADPVSCAKLSHRSHQLKGYLPG